MRQGVSDRLVHEEKRETWAHLAKTVLKAFLGRRVLQVRMARMERTEPLVSLESRVAPALWVLKARPVPMERMASAV